MRKGKERKVLRFNVAVEKLSKTLSIYSHESNKKQKRKQNKKSDELLSKEGAKQATAPFLFSILLFLSVFPLCPSFPLTPVYREPGEYSPSGPG